MTVSEMLERMDSEEVVAWMAYEKLEPFGEARADMRAAMITSTLANVNRGAKQKPFTLKDFMFDFDGQWMAAADQAKGKAERGADSISKVLHASAPRGTVTTYDGEAPVIKRIGKRARPNKRLDRILYGQSR